MTQWLATRWRSPCTMSQISPLYAVASQLAELAASESLRREPGLPVGERASLPTRQDATLLAALQPRVCPLYDVPAKELPPAWPVEELRARLPELPAGATVYLARTLRVSTTVQQGSQQVAQHGLVSAVGLYWEGLSVAAVSLVLPARALITACAGSSGHTLIGALGRSQPYDRRLLRTDVRELSAAGEAPVLLALARVVLLGTQKEPLRLTPGRERAEAFILSTLVRGLGLGLAQEGSGTLDLSTGHTPVSAWLGDNPLRLFSLGASLGPHKPPPPPAELEEEAPPPPAPPAPRAAAQPVQPPLPLPTPAPKAAARPAPQPAPKPAPRPRYEPPEYLRTFFEAQHEAQYGEPEEGVEYIFDESHMVDDELLGSVPQAVRAFYQQCTQAMEQGEGLYPGLYCFTLNGRKTYAIHASTDGDETLLAVFDGRGRSLARAWTHDSGLEWHEPELLLNTLLARLHGEG